MKQQKTKQLPDTLLVLDTSVLLDLTKKSFVTANSILELLTSPKYFNLLWLPYQVVMEYQYLQQTEFTKLQHSCQNIQSVIDRAIYNSEIKFDDAISKLQDLRYSTDTFSKVIADKLAEIKSEFSIFIADKQNGGVASTIDKLATLVTQLQAHKQVGTAAAVKKNKEAVLIKAIRDKFDTSPSYPRYYLSQPSEANLTEKQIWSEIVRKAKRKSSIKHVIFITNDKQDFWWDNSNKKRPVINPSLQAEFTQTNPEQTIEFLTLAQFYNLSLSDTTQQTCIANNGSIADNTATTNIDVTNTANLANHANGINQESNMATTKQANNTATQVSTANTDSTHITTQSQISGQDTSVTTPISTDRVATTDSGTTTDREITTDKSTTLAKAATLTNNFGPIDIFIELHANHDEYVQRIDEQLNDYLTSLFFYKRKADKSESTNQETKELYDQLMDSLSGLGGIDCDEINYCELTNSKNYAVVLSPDQKTATITYDVSLAGEVRDYDDIYEGYRNGLGEFTVSIDRVIDLDKLQADPQYLTSDCVYTNLAIIDGDFSVDYDDYY